jgi:hypothetical protein
LIVGAAFSASAQNSDGKSREQMMKEIREFKLKFLAQEIDLKEDQKARFIELYSEMSDKRAECMKDALRMERSVKKNADATEADYQKATDAMTKAKAEDAAIEKAYDDKFAQFLSQKQIYKMKEAENEFRKKMSEMRHRNAKSGKKR